jgi:REP element-mobilizing transposase RayT
LTYDLRKSAVIDPDDLILTLEAERDELWANGHENVLVTAHLALADGTPLPGFEVSLLDLDSPSTGVWPVVSWETDAGGDVGFLVTVEELGATLLTGYVVVQPETSETIELTGITRRAVVLVQGVNTELLDGSEPPFPFLGNYLAALGFTHPTRGMPEAGGACNGIDDDGDGAVDDGCPLILDYSYNGGFVLPLSGAWVAAPYICHNTSHPLAAAYRVSHFPPLLRYHPGPTSVLSPEDPMARRPRSDAPGTWFHIMNRGIARRTLFETNADIAFFLEQLGAVSERGELEIHAFALMTTHYHLLVRSPLGRLGAAMQRVQTEYSRSFNRGRKRDGPLVRGRYTSKEVRSLAYRCTLVRYIDRNPVSAGLVSQAVDYPHGSARIYARQGTDEDGWLDRSWVENEVCRRLELQAYDPGRYVEVFSRLPEHLARLVEARLRSRGVEDPVDDLLRAAPDAVLDWMKRKALLADGSRPGLPVLTPETVDDSVDAHARQVRETWRIGRRSGWFILRVGLTRQLCGLGLDEIGARVGLGQSAVSNIARLHARLLASDYLYAGKAASVASSAIRMWEGGGK